MHFHVMADIETLGTGNNALPIVLGAVKFTKDAILGKFEVGIDPDDAQRYGRVITGGTVMYWFDPKRNEARERIFHMPKVDLASALQGFSDWCRLPTTDAPDAPEDEVPLDAESVLQIGSLWGKGSTFDNIILRSAAEVTHTDWPFSFRQDECYRTLANRNPDVAYEQVGVAHVALDDALSQALHLQRICAARGFEL